MSHPTQSTPTSILKKSREQDSGDRARVALLRMTRRREGLPSNTMIFSKEAFDKLIWFRDRGNTEVGCFAQTRPDDKLYIVDLHFVKQECSSAATDFDLDAQQDYVADMMDAGLSPENFLRIWIHTHPGSSASPSGTDWETFDKVLGEMPWAVMAILAKHDKNEMYCLFRAGTSQLHIPVGVDCSHESESQWEAEFTASIHKKTYTLSSSRGYQTWDKHSRQWVDWSNTSHTPPKPQKAKKRKSVEGRKLSSPNAGEISLPKNTSKKDLSTLSGFFKQKITSSIPIPGDGWWLESDILSSIQIIDAIIDGLRTPRPFCTAMNKSLLNFTGETGMPKAPFHPEGDFSSPDWFTLSPYAALATIRGHRTGKKASALSSSLIYNHACSTPAKYPTINMFEWDPKRNIWAINVDAANEWIGKEAENFNFAPALASAIVTKRRSWDSQFEDMKEPLDLMIEVCEASAEQLMLGV